jgi:hypothetical protein
MSQWVRLWEDMPDDPKWLVVRHRASQSVTGVTVGHIIAVFTKMMTTADSHGNLVNWCDEDVAVRLEFQPEQVCAIREAMQGKVLEGNYLKGWEKRQPKREDSSTVRMRALRAKRDAEKHSVTHGDAPEEKRIDSESNSLRSLVSGKPRKRHNARNLKIDLNAALSRSQIEAATEKGLTETERIAEWGKFKNFNHAKGTEFADWNAAWRMWLEKVKPRVEQTSTSPMSNGWVPTKRIGDRTFRVGEPAPKYGGQPAKFWEPLTAEDCR